MPASRDLTRAVDTFELDAKALQLRITQKLREHPIVCHLRGGERRHHGADCSEKIRGVMAFDAERLLIERMTRSSHFFYVSLFAK